MDETLSGNATVRTYAGNRFVGERKVYCCGAAMSTGNRFSAFYPHIAFFCETCGEVWQRQIYSYEFDYQPYHGLAGKVWVVETKPCRQHGPWFLYEQPLEGLDTSTLRLIFNGLLAQTSQGVSDENA